MIPNLELSNANKQKYILALNHVFFISQQVTQTFYVNSFLCRILFRDLLFLLLAYLEHRYIKTKPFVHFLLCRVSVLTPITATQATTTLCMHIFALFVLPEVLSHETKSAKICKHNVVVACVAVIGVRTKTLQSIK